MLSALMLGPLFYSAIIWVGVTGSVASTLGYFLIPITLTTAMLSFLALLLAAAPLPAQDAPEPEDNGPAMEAPAGETDERETPAAAATPATDDSPFDYESSELYIDAAAGGDGPRLVAFLVTALAVSAIYWFGDVMDRWYHLRESGGGVVAGDPVLYRLRVPAHPEATTLELFETLDCP